MVTNEWRISDHCIKLLDWAFGQATPHQPVTTLTASAKASAPPVPEVTAPAGGESAAEASATPADGLNPTPTNSGALPPWGKTVAILAGFGIAAWIAVRALGKRADRVADVRRD